jgi:hypothetical protein
VSRFNKLVVVFFSVALLAPAASAHAAVRAAVKFVPSVSVQQRVATVQSAGGRKIRVRGTRVVARMTTDSAYQLRSAAGVVSVRVRGPRR